MRYLDHRGSGMLCPSINFMVFVYFLSISPQSLSQFLSTVSLISWPSFSQSIAAGVNVFCGCREHRWWMSTLQGCRMANKVGVVDRPPAS